MLVQADTVSLILVVSNWTVYWLKTGTYKFFNTTVPDKVVDVQSQSVTDESYTFTPRSISAF